MYCKEIYLTGMVHAALKIDKLYIWGFFDLKAKLGKLASPEIVRAPTPC